MQGKKMSWLVTNKKIQTEVSFYDKLITLYMILESIWLWSQVSFFITIPVHRGPDFMIVYKICIILVYYTGN